MSKRLDNAMNLYLEGIRDGKAREAVTKYTGARYTQHSTGVKDGIEGFVEFFEPFIARNRIRDIEILRALEDGQHVFLQVYQSLNDGESQWVTTDFFDTDEDGKIIEHWYVISQYVPQTPSGHTSVDGPTEITDLDKTEANKQIVRDLVRDVLVGEKPENINNYVSSEQYIQHNADMPDGLEHFKALALAKDRPLVYGELVLLVGQGNFVATLCRALWQGQPFAQVDLSRIQDGKVVEHWDNLCGRKKREGWHSCSSGKIGARGPEEGVLRIVTTRVLTSDFVIALIAEANQRMSQEQPKVQEQVDETERQLAEIELAIANLLDLAERFGAASAGPRIAEREAERGQLHVRLRRWEQQQEAQELTISPKMIESTLKPMCEALLEGDIRAKRDLLSKVVAKIETGPTGAELSYTFPLHEMTETYTALP